MRVPLGMVLAVALSGGVLSACGGDGHVRLREVEGPTPGASVVDLGAVSLTASNQGQTFRFNVDGASAIVIVADGGNATDIDIDSLQTPSGRQLITPSRTDANPLTGSVSPQDIGGSVATAILTGSTLDPLEPGTYTFSIASFDGAGVPNSAQVRLTAIINRRQSPATGTLPITIHLVGAPGLTASTAASSEALQDVLDEIRRMFGAIGIRIEVGGFRDIGGEPAVRLSVLDVLDSTTDRLVPDRNLNRQSDEMDELFTLSAPGESSETALVSAGGDNPAVNLFLVKEFFTRSGRVAVSGGRPGPSMLQGTAHSGVVASTLGGLDAQSETDLEDLGRRIALEIARYLGAQPTDAQDEFTPTQAHVLLRNPAVEGRTPALEIVDLGTTSLSPGISSREFRVPVEGAASLTLIADGVTSRQLRFSRLVSPSGPLAVDDAFAAPPAFRAGIPGSAVVALIPNTPLIPLQAGTYRFNLVDNLGGSSSARVTALIKRRQVVLSGRLDLNFFFVAVPGINAGTARTHPLVLALIAQFDKQFRRVGIRVASVRFRDVPDESLTVIDPNRDVNGNGMPDQLDTLFAMPRTTSAAALDLFVVRQVLGGRFIGLAGSIPGPSNVPPTRHSGVVITAFDNANEARNHEPLARIAAHEAAHYLGLYHTTEGAEELIALGLFVFDPLADTPACPVDILVQSLEAQEVLRTCPDVRNVMFPILIDDIDQSILTPDQAFVLRGNPLISD